MFALFLCSEYSGSRIAWSKPDITYLCLKPTGDSYITHCWTPATLQMATALPLLAILSTATSTGASVSPLCCPRMPKGLMDGCLEGLGESAVAGCDRVQGIGTRLAVQCDGVKLFKCCSRKASDLSCALCCIWESGSDFYTVHQRHPSPVEKSLILIATRLSYIFRNFSLYVWNQWKQEFFFVGFYISLCWGIRTHADHRVKFQYVHLFLENWSKYVPL